MPNRSQEQQKAQHEAEEKNKQLEKIYALVFTNAHGKEILKDLDLMFRENKLIHENPGITGANIGGRNAIRYIHERIAFGKELLYEEARIQKEE